MLKKNIKNRNSETPKDPDVATLHIVAGTQRLGSELKSTPMKHSLSQRASYQTSSTLSFLPCKVDITGLLWDGAEKDPGTQSLLVTAFVPPAAQEMSRQAVSGCWASGTVHCLTLFSQVEDKRLQHCFLNCKNMTKP